jgi:copper resistance protein B
VHAVHDRAVNYFVLFDQFEWQWNADGSGANVDAKGWMGQDRDRFWFRAEGDGDDGRMKEVGTDVLYGRQFSRWWDFVAGVRQDFEPGSPLTWAAVGIQGIAPYWFDIELTGYVGPSGRTRFRGEVEYELLLTNRLVLQPLVEVELFGKSDPERGIGAGVSTAEVGLRLRYEFKRELAPYVGITWLNGWGPTAGSSDADGRDTDGGRLVAGLRFWF